MLIKYCYFQFIKTPKRIIEILTNFVWFGYNFFSVDYCFKTLFSPWKKLAWEYGGVASFKDHLETFSSNAISRTMGFIMRFFIILAWLSYEALVLALGTALIILWTFLPFIAILGIYMSFKI
ncbi:MAG: hypothetical protein ACOXZP_00520 [Minisyncoccales bacterium]|jgi:hypothetical protein